MADIDISSASRTKVCYLMGTYFYHLPFQYNLGQRSKRWWSLLFNSSKIATKCYWHKENIPRISFYIHVFETAGEPLLLSTFRFSLSSPLPLPFASTVSTSFPAIYSPFYDLHLLVYAAESAKNLGKCFILSKVLLHNLGLSQAHNIAYTILERNFPTFSI